MAVFKTTVERTKLTELFALCGTEWHGPLTPSEFAQMEAKKLVDFILKGNPGRGFYLEENGAMVATCVVTQYKALYKAPGLLTLSGGPDPFAFGVSPASALRLSYVFVSAEHRKKGHMASLVQKAIAYTENEILQKELAKAPSGKDLFRLMVEGADDKVDPELARHLLSQKYVWFLYLAIGPAYLAFGFKPYPVEGYCVLAPSETQGEQLVAQLLANPGSGKRLRMLSDEVPADRDLMAELVRSAELELLTGMTTNEHTSLGGARRLLLLLANLQSMLGAGSGAGPGAGAGAGLVPSGSGHVVGGSLGHVPSAKAHAAGKPLPKFAVVPNTNIWDNNWTHMKILAQKAGDPQAAQTAQYRGAVLTNDSQRKTYYVLWAMIKQQDMQIVAMGEFTGDTAVPGTRRRGSLFTGINELGGFNFQDLDLLLGSALYVGRRLCKDPTVCVSLRDLPVVVPGPVMHDFFMNHVPQSGAHVDFIRDFSQRQVLPMVRPFGCPTPEFELDWIANGLFTWG